MISLRQGLLLDRDGEATALTCPVEVLTKSEAHRAPVLVRRQRLWPTVSAVTLAAEDGKAGLTAPQLLERRRVGFGAIALDTLQFTAGSLIGTVCIAGINRR